MYAGIVTAKKTAHVLGTHQRLNMGAFKMIAPYFEAGSFPDLRQILHFEGVNGPDGIKIKLGKYSKGTYEDPSHMYDPVTGKGQLPQMIQNHYNRLVMALHQKDLVRASFEASWLAHFLSDGLTPAHHYPYDEKKREFVGKECGHGFIKRNWSWLGVKGVLTTHIHFEAGVAATLFFARLRPPLDPAILSRARQMGIVEFFRNEAAEIAKLDLYTKFYQKGWTAEIARSVRKHIAPRISQVIGVIWLIAYLEAGYKAATEAIAEYEYEYAPALATTE